MAAQLAGGGDVLGSILAAFKLFPDSCSTLFRVRALTLLARELETMKQTLEFV